MKITLRNDFHNTSVNLILRGNYLSPGQIRRAKNTLCGIAGCTCSGPAGTRGRQDFYVDEWYPDGSARVFFYNVDQLTGGRLCRPDFF